MYEYDKALDKYLWKGLDLKRFAVLHIQPITGKRWRPGVAAVVMKARYPWGRPDLTTADDPAPYCVEFGGSGKYFTTYDDMKEYFEGRFKHALPYCDRDAGKDS